MKENLRASRRVRFAAGVATTVVLSTIGLCVCRFIDVVRPWLVHLTVGFCLLGSVLLMARRGPRSKADTEDAVLRFGQNPRYWGACVLASAGLTFLAVSILDPQPKVVHARVEEAPPPPEVVFPELMITGVVLNGDRSSAVLGSTPVYVGELVDGMQVVHIFEDGVVVEKQGERRIYYRNTTHAVLPAEDDVICSGSVTNRHRAD